MPGCRDVVWYEGRQGLHVVTRSHQHLFSNILGKWNHHSSVMPHSTIGPNVCSSDCEWQVRATSLKACPHCFTKVRLSHFYETVSLFCDSVDRPYARYSANSITSIWCGFAVHQIHARRRAHCIDAKSDDDVVNGVDALVLFTSPTALWVVQQIDRSNDLASDL